MLLQKGEIIKLFNKESQYEKAIEKLSTEFDTAERGKLAIELQQAILDDNAYIFCSFLEMNMISKANVSNWTAHAATITRSRRSWTSTE